MTVYGVDVSHYQGVIDWAKVRGVGAAIGAKDFAILKATEGTAWIDNRFTANTAQARAVGLTVGAYHLFRPGLDPVLQARHYHAVVGSLGKGDLIPWLDVEVDRPSVNSPIVPSATIVAELHQCVTECDRLFGVMPGIYTASWFWNRLPAGAKFSALPLWVARYETPGGVFPLPTGWSRYALQQYTSSGRVAGIAGNVDLDWTPNLKDITVLDDRAKIAQALAALQGVRSNLDEAEKLLQEVVG